MADPHDPRLLVLLFIIVGYIVPQRFQCGLAIVYCPSATSSKSRPHNPAAVESWARFYRDARAFLHPDFRLSAIPGAVASLHAESAGTHVNPSGGMSLYRETLDSDWELVQPQGRRAHAGDVYRIGERGPYFRIATRGRS